MSIPLLPEFDADGYQVEPTTAKINEVIAAINAALTEASLIAALEDSESSVSAAIALLGGGSSGVMPWPVLNDTALDSRTVYSASTSTGAMTANRCYAMPLIVRQACSIDSMGVGVTSGASGVVRFGLYEVNLSAGSSFGAPSALIADFGTGDTQYTGNRKVWPEYQIEAGVYYMTAAFQGTPTVELLTPTSQGPGRENDDATGRNACVYTSGGYDALPDPFGGIGGALTSGPRIWVQITY